MEFKICLFITIIIYSVIASQAFSYIISLRRVQLQMSAVEYLQFRKRTDAAFRKNYQPAMYALIVSSCILMILSIIEAIDVNAILSIFSFLAVIVDVLLALKGNIPINNSINGWDEKNIPTDWMQYRQRWLTIFAWRQVAIIAGLIALVSMAVFFL